MLRSSCRATGAFTPAIGVLLAALLLLLPAPSVASGGCADAADAVRAAAEAYLKARGEAEGITAATIHVSCGADGPGFDVAVGTFGRTDPRPASPRALIQVGSNTKHFTSALILGLQGEGLLDVGDPLGRFLPRYPYWSQVTLRQLLDMTSPIPDYADMPWLTAAVGADPDRHFTLEELVAAVAPERTRNVPPNRPWSYSNTNYILAAMVVEEVTGRSIEDVLRETFAENGLADTYYFEGAIDPAVIARSLSGYFENPDCESIVPGCAASGLPSVGPSWRGSAE